ncbi:molybdenum ABC transporter ATP-binding protein [Parvibaculaceae bacterium PLY_AMNH_Bact1]|nr:molybdenum ABC transporter ATP-binding protein [Parvibaculaceae bacterium PLY_AMNH_Bact1]
MSSVLSISVQKQEGTFALDANLEASAGVTAIIGPSGAGKSMLLSTIAGLADPDKGYIRLDEQALFDAALNVNLSPEHRELGMVFQDARLFPHMTVKSNLTFSRRQTRAALSTLEEIVDLMDIGSLLPRRPHHLSGGEKQRVAIGRALLSAPAALLMDEPLASLDLARRREIMPFLERLRHRFDLPILYVSHNLDETLRLADSVIVIDQGKILARGSVEETLSRIDVQSLILGGAKTNDHPEPVTIVAATIGKRSEDGLFSIETPWGVLTAPNITGRYGDQVRLRIRARDIVLSTAEPTGLSIRNVIAGQVGTMTEAGNAQVDVLVRPSHDSNAQPVWARITRRAATELDLQPGRPIWALLKAVVLTSDIELEALR